MSLGPSNGFAQQQQQWAWVVLEELLICSNTLILQLLSSSLPSPSQILCVAKEELKHGNDLAGRQKQMLWTLSRCCSNSARTPSPVGH